jgi:very-short-patch-repair endonuclease
MHLADRVANELAYRQRGVFAGWQLDRAGVDRDVRQRRVRTGAWRRLLYDVYALAGVPPSFDQRLWTAWLAVGPQSVVSHETAAELHAIPNVMRGRLVLTVPHSGWHRIPGVFVHQLSDVLPDHVIDAGALPVTRPPRTIVDLAAVVHPARLAHIVEDTKHAGIASYAAIGECLSSVARRGKPGVRSLVRVLDRLGPGDAATMSALERKTLDMLRDRGLPMPIPQYPFPGRQFVNGCVDFAYPAAKLVLETDGRRWHSRIKELTRDRERDLEAARHGWQTLRFLYEHVTADPDGTADTIRTVVSERISLLAS